eukprot:jgi/Mesen1/8358/ME000463S07795
MGANQSHDGVLGGEEEEEEFHEASSSIKVASPEAGGSTRGPSARLYRHKGGLGSQSKWILVQKVATWVFSQKGGDEDEDEDDEPEEDDWRRKKQEEGGRAEDWYLLIGNRVQALVSERLGIKFNDDKLRADFIADGVWALVFKQAEEYKSFVVQFQDCLFENVHHVQANEANRLKVIGKDFLGWAKGEDADETMWDADENFEDKVSRPLGEIKETYADSAQGRTPQSLTMGALANSYLLHSTGIEVYRNRANGLHGDGLSIRLGEGGGDYSTPKKGMLMRGETNMMLFSPAKTGDPHASGVQQLDIDTGKVVSNWRFEKDGTAINMRDITGDSKSAQLENTQATFLGLDDNRLCRWDMRDRHGIVQTLTSPAALNWSEGHQFSRGTNFQCFDTAGDGSIAVGSRDGKVRLYSSSSMRMAKTAFPGLGSPITHISVTYDGRWVLATTDTYLMLISTVFRDKDGREKTGFTARMGSKTAAPRLLKLNPVDGHAAGASLKMQGGHFSFVTEEGRQERNIVASVGQYSVVWNFRRVKQTDHDCYRYSEGLKSCYCYKIVPRDESIIDSQFMHDNHTGIGSPEAPLVVATPHRISSFNV